jgi:hypothetical protein
MSELLNREIATVDKTEIVHDAVTPMGMIEMAVQRGAGIDVIERIAKLQREMTEEQRRVEFDDAMSRCQGKMRRIAADMTNPQTHSRYASYAALDRVIRPIYTSEGMSVSFSEAEGSTAEYIVMLAHVSRGGHTRTYRKGMPLTTVGPQGKAVMTPTHAAGSGGSYAKRYLLKDIFNLAIGEDDDDGNLGAIEKKDMPVERFAFNMERIEGAKTLKELQMAYVNAYKESDTYRDEAVKKQFIEAKDARKEALECE